MTVVVTVRYEGLRGCPYSRHARPVQEGEMKNGGCNMPQRKYERCCAECGGAFSPVKPQARFCSAKCLKRTGAKMTTGERRRSAIEREGASEAIRLYIMQRTRAGATGQVIGEELGMTINAVNVARMRARKRMPPIMRAISADRVRLGVGG